MITPISYFLTDNRYMGLLGIITILGIAVAFSRHRKRIDFALVGKGLLLQFVLAFFALKTSVGQYVFQTLADGFGALYSFAGAGTDFVFGALADGSGPWGVVFAIKVVPIIIFFGALMALLYHLGIIQLLVKGISWLMKPILGTSGAETLCAVANSMLGQTEAPLLIRHYLRTMTTSEILVVMVSGMATLSGALLAVYGEFGVPIVHLLGASIMAIPTSIVIAKILIPETEVPKTIGGNSLEMKVETKNVLDAISSGTVDGMHLAANVVAMLIAFISIIAMINFGLERSIGITLGQVFGFIFSPLAALIGVSPGDVGAAGTLIGTKVVVNEFVAYLDFVQTSLTERSRIILTYALCGFSNFSCIGIQIGGIGALAPEKRTLLTRLGLTALLGGTLTNLLNAAVVSLFI